MKSIKQIFSLLKSEETLAAIKVITAFVVLVHSIDEYNKSKRKIGFRR